QISDRCRLHALFRLTVRTYTRTLHMRELLLLRGVPLWIQRVSPRPSLLSAHGRNLPLQMKVQTYLHICSTHTDYAETRQNELSLQCLNRQPFASDLPPARLLRV